MIKIIIACVICLAVGVLVGFIFSNKKAVRLFCTILIFIANRIFFKGDVRKEFVAKIIHIINNRFKINLDDKKISDLIEDIYGKIKPYLKEQNIICKENYSLNPYIDKFLNDVIDVEEMKYDNRI